MRYELKRIEIWPTVKIVFILSLLLGFFIGILYAGFFMMLSSFEPFAAGSDFGPIGSLGAGFSILLVIGMTLGLAFLYTIGAIIFAVLYNLLAGAVGGFQVEINTLDSHEEKTSVG